MAGPNKKPREQFTPAQPDAESSGSEGEESEDEHHVGEEITTTFEGRNPSGVDFHGIKQLLQQLFLKAHIDLSEMSDLLINQNGIGSVLKQGLNDSDDEEDVDMIDDTNVYGITSVLRMSLQKNAACIEQFRKVLDELCEKHADEATKNLFQDILRQSGNVGLLLNERIVNIPATISPKMLETLCGEILRKKVKEQTYNFEHFVMISKTYRKPSTKGNQEETYANDEEEVIAKYADAMFEFSVENETDTVLLGKWLEDDVQLIPFRKVFIFKASDMNQILTEINELLNISD